MANIVITGGSRGIGFELARLALHRGDRVLVVARKPQEAPDLRGLSAKFGAKFEVAALELSEAGAPEALSGALARWACVDVLINNAGVYHRGEAAADFMDSFLVNSVAPYLVTKALTPKLRAAPQPKAIQITSLMGSITDNTSGGSCAYRASKTALNMLNKCLSLDEKWLTTAVVHPGWVKTRMGGDEAPTTVAESAAGIWTVIEKLKPADSGAFFDFEGERLPW